MHTKQVEAGAQRPRVAPPSPQLPATYERPGARALAVVSRLCLAGHTAWASSPLVQRQDGIARSFGRVGQALPRRILDWRKLLLAPHFKQRGGGSQWEGVEDEQLQLDALRRVAGPAGAGTLGLRNVGGKREVNHAASQLA